MDIARNKKADKDKNYHRAASLLNRMSISMTPAKLDPISFAKRLDLNQLDEFPSQEANHPAPEAVAAFKIFEEFQKPVEISKEKEFWYIQEQTQLDKMVEILSTKTVIGVDVEVDSEYSYIPIITLIQLSCNTHDFVIDATKLFSSITKSLRPIFMNDSIVKLVFGYNDVGDFKRDFGLFFVGLVDLQLVHQRVTGEAFKIGLDKLVKYYVGKEIDKSHKSFHFKLRPLPKNVLEYAANDARVLLECWEVMKRSQKCREYLLNAYDYEAINDTILRPASLPVAKEGSFYFEKALKQVSKSKRELFTEEKHFEIFKVVLEWRKGIARIEDVPVNKVLNLGEVTNLCLEPPYTVQALESVHSVLGKGLKSEWKKSLVQTIGEFNVG